MQFYKFRLNIIYILQYLWIICLFCIAHCKVLNVNHNQIFFHNVPILFLNAFYSGVYHCIGESLEKPVLQLVNKLYLNNITENIIFKVTITIQYFSIISLHANPAVLAPRVQALNPVARFNSQSGQQQYFQTFSSSCTATIHIWK